MRIIMLLVLMSFSSTIFAQVQTGTHTFTAQDVESNWLPNIQVSVTNMALNITNTYRTNQNGRAEIPFLWVGHVYSVTMSAPNRTFQTYDDRGRTAAFVFAARRGERIKEFIDIEDHGPGLHHPYRIRMHVQNENDPGATVVLTNITTGAIQRFGVPRSQGIPNIFLNNLEFGRDYQVHVESGLYNYIASYGFQIAASRVFNFTTPPRQQVASFELFNPAFVPAFSQIDIENPLPAGNSLIFGSVTRDNFGLDHSVRIEGVDSDYHVVVQTAERGVFRFSDVPVGSYRVTPQAHPTYIFEPATRLVELYEAASLEARLDFRAAIRGGQVSGVVSGDCIEAGLAGNAGGCTPGTVQPYPTPGARLHISSCRSANPGDCRRLDPSIGSATVQADMNGQFATPFLPSGLYQIVVDTDLAALGTVFDDGVVAGFRIEWGAIQPNGQVQWGAIRHLAHVQNQSQRNWNFRWRLVRLNRRQQGSTAESSESESGFGVKAAKFKLLPQLGQKLNLPKGFGLAKNAEDQSNIPRLKPVDKPDANAALKVKQSIFMPAKPNLNTRVVAKHQTGSIKMAKITEPNKIDLSKKLSINSVVGKKAILKIDLKGSKSNTQTDDNLIFDGTIHNVGRGTAKQVSWYLLGKVSGMPANQDKIQKGVINHLKGPSRKNLKIKFNASQPGKWNLRLCAKQRSAAFGNYAKQLCSNVVSLVVNEPPSLKKLTKPKQQPTLDQLKLKPKLEKTQKVQLTIIKPVKKTKNKKDSKKPGLLLKPASGATKIIIK